MKYKVIFFLQFLIGHATFAFDVGEFVSMMSDKRMLISSGIISFKSISGKVHVDSIEEFLEFVDSKEVFSIAHDVNVNLECTKVESILESGMLRDWEAQNGDLTYAPSRFLLRFNRKMDDFDEEVRGRLRSEDGENVYFYTNAIDGVRSAYCPLQNSLVIYPHTAQSSFPGGVLSPSDFDSSFVDFKDMLRNPSLKIDIDVNNISYGKFSVSTTMEKRFRETMYYKVKNMVPYCYDVQTVLSDDVSWLRFYFRCYQRPDNHNYINDIGEIYLPRISVRVVLRDGEDDAEVRILKIRHFNIVELDWEDFEVPILNDTRVIERF